MKIKVIGAGGIGTALLSPLGMYLQFNTKKSERIVVTVIDGDVFESRNHERQIFHRIGNKADVTVERLQPEFPDVVFKARNEYVTQTSIEYLIEDGDIVFLCVDNHKTRSVVSSHCEDLDDVVLISGGNDFTDGNIQTHIRKGGKNLTLPIANDYHLEIKNPTDKSPDEIGCQELAEAEPQLIFANFFMASLMLNAFYAYLMGKLNYDEVYADILTNNCRAVKRRKVAVQEMAEVA